MSVDCLKAPPFNQQVNLMRIAREDRGTVGLMQNRSQPEFNAHVSTTLVFPLFHEVVLTLTKSRTSLKISDLTESGSVGQALIRL